MKRCGSRCLAERRNQCRELQKWSRCLLTMIGFEQVSRRYLSKNSESRSIAETVSTALTAGSKKDSSTTAQDWSRTDKCPFCNGSRVTADNCSEKVSMRMEAESESTISDGEHYGANCSSQIKTEQTTSSSPVENPGYLESSGGSQPSYMHHFPSLYTAPIPPLMTSFVPLPEIANQLYFQSLLQWSTSGLLQQQLNSQCSTGKENGDSDAGNHLLQHMTASVSTKSDEAKRTAAHFCANNDLPCLYAGLPKSPFSSESLTKQLAAIYAYGNNDDASVEEDQPLDLSSRRALQAATQSAASSVHSSRDVKRPRASLNVISNKPPNPPLMEERNDLVFGRAKNAAGTAAVQQPSMNKRNYSQADLDAAVRDIRCGRLGTRRASVVYGIPRSTLRNKIYKLEAAEDLRIDGGGSGRKKRADVFGTAVAASDTRSPSAMTNNPVVPSNDTNKALTEAVTPPAEALAIRDSTFLPKSDEEIDSTSRSVNRESVTVNGETHRGSAAIENKKSLWSPFIRQQSSEPKNAGVEEKKTSGSPANSTGSQSDWKRSRPKRGQYRKYNKDALDEAVRSVRRGEMSVHRAGSFYGVPHSTLEYKVKERNLMRTKRKKVTEENLFDRPTHGLTVSPSEKSSPIQSSPQHPSAELAIGDVSTGPPASTAVPS